MGSTPAVFFAIAFTWFIPIAGLSAQSVPKSSKECSKLVPRDWGTNFGEEWKQHEAGYWGCRLDVPVEAIQEWQRFSSGMIADLIPVVIDNQQIVFVESMEGTAHCYWVSAVRKSKTGWEAIWSPPLHPDSMESCTLACPGIRIKVHGKILMLETPHSADPKEDQAFSCKHAKWNKETYRWNGQTYQSTSDHAQGKTAPIHE